MSSHAVSVARRRIARSLLALALGASLAIVGPSPSAALAEEAPAWTFQVTPSPPQILNAVHFVDPWSGWVVGYNGTILKTADGGASWIAQSSGTTQQLTDVFFLDVSTGWAVGKGGTVLRTTDGYSWSTVGTLTADLTAVRFVDGMTGWAVGSGVYKTSDGGDTWTQQTCRTSWGGWPYLEDVDFLDASTGWVAGPGVWKTTDGGTTWFEQYSAYEERFASIDFLDAMTGWICYPTFKTTTGGAIWTRQPLLYDLAGNHSAASDSLQFVTPQTGYALGGAACFFKTTDGGTNWKALPFPQNNGIKCMYFADANVGYAVGYSGVIFKTTTGGETWSASSLTLSTSASGVKYGGGATLTARLKTPAGGPVIGKAVRFERLSGTTWVLLGTVTTGADGSARKWVTGIKGPTKYRARYLESFPYRASTSASILIKPKATVSTPQSVSSIGRYRPFVVWGALSPRHAAGLHSVTLRFYHYETMGWVLRGTLGTTNYAYTTTANRWAATPWLGLTGRWYVAATHSDAGHAYSISPPKYITVY